jgi:small subunit ribosomal protein S19
MTRSLKKGLYVNERIYKKVLAMVDSGEKKVLKIWDRASQIVPEMV